MTLDNIDLSFTKIKSISVLIPVLNERDNLLPTVERLLQALNITVEDYEIIIINDGSTDGTDEVANELANSFPYIKVFHNSKSMGLGYVYLQGVNKSTKNYFVYIPGDNTWPYRSFFELLGNLGKADIITSFSTNPEVRPFMRRLVSSLYTKTLNILFNKQMRYYNGLTIYPIEYLRNNPITTFGFGFQSEALLKAIYAGYSYIEIGLPIDERTAGGSKAVNIKNIVSVLGNVFNMFFELRIFRSDLINRLKKFNIHSVGIKNHSSIDELGFNINETFKGSKDNSISNESQTIVITGASSGIGAALTKQLFLDGHKVFVCSRNKENLFNSIAPYKSVTGKPCDVTNEKDVISFVNFIQKKTDKIDILINCAGKFGAIGPIDKTDSDEWLNTIKTNLYGPYLMIKHFIPLLKNSNNSKIINFSGGGAFSPFQNYSAYAASKAALIRLTETLAIELSSYNIAVNAIAPGIIATPAHEATLKVGEELAGKLHYQRTLKILDKGGASINNVVSCIRTLISSQFKGLTGKTISANFDPWNATEFQRNLSKISSSDLYTLSRINIVHLPKGDLKTILSKTWAEHETHI